MNFAEVAVFASKLPGVTLGAKWGNPTWIVNDKGFLWQRPLSKADIARFVGEPPQGEIIGVRTENLDSKEAILSAGRAGFFTIAHFRSFPAFLIALEQASDQDVRFAIEHAWQSCGGSNSTSSAKLAPGRRVVSRRAKGPPAKRATSSAQRRRRAQ